MNGPDGDSEDLGEGERGSVPGGVPAGQEPVPAPNAQPPSPATPAPAAGNVPDLAGAADGEIKKLGKRNFAAIYIDGKDGNKGHVARLSDQEAIALRSYLKYKSFEVAAKDAGGIKQDSVRRMFRRPHVKEFLEAVIEQAAIQERVDLGWVMKGLVGTWEGHIKPDQAQQMAIRELAKILTPRISGKGVQVNVSQQNNSVYSGLNREGLDAEWGDARATAAD